MTTCHVASDDSNGEGQGQSCEMVVEEIGSSEQVVGLQDQMTCRIFMVAILEKCGS